MKKLLLIAAVSVLFASCEKIKDKRDFRNELVGNYYMEESNLVYDYYNGAKKYINVESYKTNATVTKSTIDERTLVYTGYMAKVYLKDGIATYENKNYTIMGTYEFTDVPNHKQLKINLERESGGRTTKYDFIGTR